MTVADKEMMEPAGLNSTAQCVPDTGRKGAQIRRGLHANMSMDSKNLIARPYQEEIYEMAKKRNTIVCLGTGTGKTFIAVMLIDEFAREIRKDYSDGGKRTVVLVPKVPLVAQQAKVIQDHLDLKVGQYRGDMNVDTWDKTVWEKELTKNHVLVMTAEIFRVMITQGFMPLAKVNLLILDEAHWAIGNHPYREIMKCFDTCSEPPRILGLSASLINCKAKPSNILALIKELERTLRSTCETASDLETVSRYGTKPKEIKWLFDKSITALSNRDIKAFLVQMESFALFLKDLSHQYSNLPASVSQLKKCLGTVNHVLETMGYWCARKAAEIYVMELTETMAMFLNSDPVYAALLSATATLLNYLRATVGSILNGYAHKEQLTKFSSPKMFCLLQILSEYKPVDDGKGKDTEVGRSRETNFTGNSLCGIIFAERRAVVRVLSMWLQELSKADPENFGFLKAEYVLGHGGNAGGMTSTMSNKRQEEALSKFRKHEHNLLIATSVLEEGLDVPCCNLVVRYDLPKSFREYIQSKGRARAEKAKYIMLIENEPENVKKVNDTLEEFVEIENILMKNCNRKADEPDEDEEEESEETSDVLIPPYMPIKADGAPRVTLNSAISLVNRYCIKLPSDSFTKLAPRCEVETIATTSYKCTITLPINSPVRHPIEGPEMCNKKLAKKAAALEVCKRLHEARELDDNFLPVGKEGIKSMVDLGLDVGDEDDGDKAVKGRPGTTKRRQYYFKKVADALTGCPPKNGTPCRLYVFTMKLTCPIPEEQNTRGRKITDPAESPRCFGLVTTKHVPPICSFPVFTRSGEVLVSLVDSRKEFMLNDDEVARIKKFHEFTFNDVLCLNKYPMTFEPEKSSSSYFIAPVLYSMDESISTPSAEVDWDFISKVEHYEKQGQKEISEEERKNFVFEEEVYKDAVVKPWYRQNKLQFYFYVAEITDLKPTSPFPDEGFETFEKYYKEKYKRNIMNKDQPLLDVDHTSVRLNLLTPRYVNRKGMTLPMSTQKTKKEKRENLQQKQILVPELCIVHPFPASFWRKAVCLPCILYRVNCLLVAEELRQDIAKSINVGVIDLPPGKSWPPLDFGWTLADVLSQNEAAEPVEEKPAVHDDGWPQTETWSDLNAPTDCDSKEKAAVDDTADGGDFVIDTFDPSQCSFDNALDNFEDAIVDWSDLDIIDGPPEVKKAFAKPLFDWTDNTNVDAVKIREIGDDDFTEDWDSGSIRIGSPSTFENIDSNWGAGWEENTTQVFDIGVPGLTTISGPVGLNLHGLSKDLANLQEKDVWDIFDDYDSDDELPADDEDDEAAEFDPFYQPKKNESATKQSKEELLNDIFANGFITEKEIEPSVEDRAISQLCKEIQYASDEKDVKQESVQIKFAEVHFTAPSSIVGEDVNDGLKADAEEAEALLHAANTHLEEKSEETSMHLKADVDDEQKNLDSLETPAQPVTEKTIPLRQLEPTFGELLPNRDVEKGSSSEVTLKFDPYKSQCDENDGPSPAGILQALTMSNASDGINLERLETVGDSFLKYAVTAFLYCFCPSIHEGKLSCLRSSQISNLNLYRLGKKKGFGELMIGTKFEPSDNWLPPGYIIPQGLEQALIDTGTPSLAYNIGAFKDLDWNKMTESEIRDEVMKRKTQCLINQPSAGASAIESAADVQHIPYNLLTQHSIPDKSIADCVEALIGSYLISSGPKGALLFMKWLGLKVMPDDVQSLNQDPSDPIWHWLRPSKPPLLFDEPKNLEELMRLYKGSGLDRFEREVLKYEFNDKAYLVQAFTHNSYCDNHVTDCYQRLEFLGDAVLDFLITRHLYEDKRKHSPGALTDLRSALVNNNIFAKLSVQYEFQKYLKVSSQDLFRVITAFVERFNSGDCATTGADYSLFVGEGECENAEDVEVPKALGDIFESVAGAIYLDSGMSLDAVWRVYYAMMKPEIEHYSKKVPKSHIRELLEREPQKVVFGKPERIPGRKVRVIVEVFGHGDYVGIGRNKRIAKCTAARRALRALNEKRSNL